MNSNVGRSKSKSTNKILLYYNQNPNSSNSPLIIKKNKINTTNNLSTYFY
jgi:hypothetical protein